MDSVILGILVMLAVWIFMKRRQRNKGNSGILPEMPPEQRQIPRIGKAGTITKGQLKALKTNYFEATKQWSFEEAALVLDAVTYLRAVCTQFTGKKLPPIEVQNELLIFILKDKDLRDYIRNWGNNWRKTGVKDEIPKLKHNSQFEQVANQVSKLLNYKNEMRAIDNA